MQDNNYEFMRRVGDAYLATMDENNLSGNFSDVARQFGITRPKVQKILITLKILETNIQRKIEDYREQGYSDVEICQTLGISKATLNINQPYEKVIYNGVEKTVGAIRVESFRKREEHFSKMKNDGTNNQIISEEEMSGLSGAVRLHVELDCEWKYIEDVEYTKSLLHIKHGKTISRDFFVPACMPLHNLHYAINEAFGFTNSHLHKYEAPFKKLKMITDDNPDNYKKLIGVVFNDPERSLDNDFWDDDYDGGSPKKWMRSKYNGPYYINKKETYTYLHKKAKDVDVSRCKNLEDIRRLHLGDCEPLNVLESTVICDVLYPKSSDCSIKSFDSYWNEYKKSKLSHDKSERRVPFTDELDYYYDYGDGWMFKITIIDGCKDLIRDKRITKDKFEELKQKCITDCGPVFIAADGYNLVDDVGGVGGLINFLETLNAQENGLTDEKEDFDYYNWAHSNFGWVKKVPSGKVF